jgi:ATP-binding cassette, subfamily B, bacterial IrtA/YbtP
MSSCEKDVSEPKKLSPIKQVLLPIQKQLTIAMIFTIVGAMLNLIPIFSIFFILDFIFQTNTNEFNLITVLSDDVFGIVSITLFLLFIGMLLITFGEMLAHLADNKMTYKLRINVMQHLEKVPLGWFSQRTSGEVKQILQDDIEMLHGLTAHFYPAIGRAIGTISMIVIYLLWINWIMTLIVVLPFLGFFIFLRKAFKASANNMEDFSTKMALMNSATVEFVNAIPIIKTFNGAGKSSTRFQNAVNEFAEGFRQFTRHLVKAMAHAHAMISPITILGIVFVMGVMFLKFGWMSPIQILVFAFVAPLLCAPVLYLHTLLHDLDASKAAAQNVVSLLNTPVLEVTETTENYIQHGYDVEFHDVHYAYQESNKTLSNLNFKVPAGSVTAIVGTSGAGKSTIAQLLLRFFDPTEGFISIGGVDLRTLNPEELYQQIGFVLQDTHLIHGSIKENIKLGKEFASLEEIERAAKNANIHEQILALPKGYESIVGADIQLSGGERQRLCIARAILINPPIFVLDEPTAAMDVDNELLIQQAFSNFNKNKTLLIITHRLETVIHADQILVVEQGSILERGTHTELLALSGRYADLWAAGSTSKNEMEGLSC